MSDGKKISLSAENLLLRGSSLRNTDWVIGVVTFAGHDTRIMKNSIGSKQKFSKLEKLITKSIVIIFLIECVLCFIAAAFSTVWIKINDEKTNAYLDMMAISSLDADWEWYEYIQLFLKTFFTWILLFTNMVPISLLVTMEVVKFAQALFIGWDINIYDE